MPWRASAAALPARAAVYAAVLAFFLYSLFFGDALPVMGNLHDAFIWTNAAYTVKSGLVPHVDVSSPLGVVYFYLCAWASALTQRASDIPAITGLIVYVFLLCSMALFVRHLGGRTFLDASFLLFVVLVSGRHISFRSLSLLWYGTYNRFCWAVLLFFTILLLARRQALLAPTERHKIHIALLAGCLLSILFLLKVNFAVAFAAIYAGWLGASCKPRDLHMLALPAALVAAAIGVAHLVAGDMAAYGRDIWLAALARAHDGGGSRLGVREVGAALAFLGANVLIDRRVDDPARIDLRRLVFACGLAGGILIGIAGDFSRPIAFFAVVLGIRVLALHSDLLPSLLRWPLPPRAGLAIFPLFLVYFVMLETYSIVQTGLFRLDVYPRELYRRVSWQQLGPDPKRLNFVIGRGAGFPGYSAVAGIVGDSPDSERIFRAFSQLAGIAFYYDNSTYVAMVEEGVRVVRRSDHAQARILALEFTNPIPFLLAAPPVKAPLWLHKGTTFGGRDVGLLDHAFATADIVMVPHVTVDPRMRPVLNAMFARFNAAASRFCEFHVGKYWTFYQVCPGHAGG